jgi:uncharacterized protein YkwD
MMNRERAAVGVPPLVWSDSLAAGSKTWADSIAATGVARHATDAEKGSPYGEVIAVWGPSGPGTLIPSVQFWINEKTKYHGETMNSTNYLLFGHYTQIVWRNEQQVGCGKATGSDKDYLVCRFNLPGNWGGQKPY